MMRSHLGGDDASSFRPWASRQNYLSHVIATLHDERPVSGHRFSGILTHRVARRSWRATQCITPERAQLSAGHGYETAERHLFALGRRDLSIHGFEKVNQVVLSYSERTPVHRTRREASPARDRKPA